MVAAAAPALAGKKKKKPPAPPAPVATSLFLHSTEQFGEAEIPSHQIDGTWMKMDATEPPDGDSKSMFVTNYSAGPNSNCNANSLVPVWVAPFSGHVVGDIKITLNYMGTPAKIELALTPDVTGSQCNDAKVDYAASTIVDVPAGEGTLEVTITGVDFVVGANLALQVSNANESGLPDPPPPAPCLGCRTTPNQVRLLYDSADAASSVQLSCFPNAGATSCVTE